jgi:hypothetical protein
MLNLLLNLKLNIFKLSILYYLIIFSDLIQNLKNYLLFNKNFYLNSELFLLLIYITI